MRECEKMDIQKATEEKLERKMQMGVPIDETMLEGLIQKNVVSVPISDDVMNIIDDLMTSGHVNSQSEGFVYPASPARYENGLEKPKSIQPARGNQTGASLLPQIATNITTKDINILVPFAED